MAEKTLSVKLTLNDKQFQSGLRKASTNLKKLGTQMQRTGQTLSRNFTLPLLAAGVASVRLASSFEETLDKTRKVFRESSKEVEDFAKTTIESFGISELSALDMASLFGAMSDSAGINTDKAAEMATTLVGLAGDMSSFHDVSIERSQTALAAIFSGETEALRRLGVDISAATLKQLGYKDTMSQSEKIMLRYQSVLEQTTTLQGNFAETSESAANQARTLSESVKQLGVELGTQLLPFAKQLISFAQSLVDQFASLSDETKSSLLQFSGITTIAGPLLIFFGSLIKSAGTLLATFRKFSAILKVIFNGFKLLTPAGRVIGLVLLILTQMNGLFESLSSSISSATRKIKEFLTPLREFFGMGGDELDIGTPVGTFEPITTPTKTPPKKPKPTFRVPPRVEPIPAGPITDFSGGMSFAPMMAASEDYMETMLQNVVITQNLSQLADELSFRFESFGHSVQGAFAQALQSSDGFFKTFLAGAKQALKALAAQIASMVILNALLGGTGLGTMMGFKDIGGFSGIPSLFQGMGASSGGVEVFGTISGSDILLSSDRAGSNRNRTSGY